MTRRPIITGDQQFAAIAGVAAVVLGVVLLGDAFERSGRPRPWPLRLLTPV